MFKTFIMMFDLTGQDINHSKIFGKVSYVFCCFVYQQNW